MGIDIHGLQRPKLRGRLHLSRPRSRRSSGSSLLLQVADSGLAHAAAWVYGSAAVLLYLSSGVYHVFTQSPRAMRVMQRVDHSMIYVLIAGTFTPFGLLVLDGGWRWASLAVMWSGALLGVVLTITAFERYRKLVAALYIVLGWAGLMLLPPLIDRPVLLAWWCSAAASTPWARCCSRSAGPSSRPAGSATTRSGTSSSSPPAPCSTSRTSSWSAGREQRV